MAIFKAFIFSVALLFLSGCRNAPGIDTFDALSWRQDTNGCQGNRLTQLELLIDQQGQLMGWSEKAIVAYLGPPDYRELYVRNQKFLIYFLEPASACGLKGKSNPLRLYLRMDALGESQEISLKNQ